MLDVAEEVSMMVLNKATAIAIDAAAEVATNKKMLTTTKNIAFLIVLHIPYCNSFLAKDLFVCKRIKT